MTGDLSDVKKQKKTNTNEEAPEEVLEVVPTAEPETQTLHIKSIHQRMLDAQDYISRTPFVKDLKNTAYASVSIDKVRRAVREACTQAGITHAMVNVQYTKEPRGTTMHLYGSAVMRFYNADDPTDFFDHPTIGHAMDNGDKDAAKLMTNLAKIAYKEVFGIGEQSQDDIDSYSNEDIEAEAERIEIIRARRARNQAAAKEDPFFSDPRAALRKRIGAMLSKDGPDYVEGAEEVVNRYKSEYGQLPQWSKETLEACIKEASE